MKKLNTLSASSFIKLLFAFFTVALFITAVIVPDRAQMFNGMMNITGSTIKVPTNDFDIGGYAGSFFDAGLVCLACTLLFCLPKAKANAGSVIGFLLTMGFCFWGLNIMNMWFGILGVLAYCLVKRENPAKHVNTMLFTTALTPLYSDLLLRYPDAAAHGFSWYGLAFAVAVGLFVGFFLPAGLPHSPNIHKGYSIYSAAIPIGFMSFFLRAVLYSLPGNEIPAAPVNHHHASWEIADAFCIAVFVICIAVAFMMGCTPKKYWQLLKDVWPSMLGYALICCIFRQIVGEEYQLVINNQTIVIGLCFANCLAPIAGKYGWWAGTIAAMLHYCIVKFVPEMHGGFLLYNGGFTSGMICLMFIPVLECFCKTKDERKAARLQKAK